MNHPVFVFYEAKGLIIFAPSNFTMSLSEQEIQRREKLAQIKEMGIDPYPAPLFPMTHSSIELKDLFEKNPEDENLKEVCFAGRILGIRDMGKACFVQMQDEHGKIQAYVRRDDIANGEDSSLYDLLFKKLTDIGDIIGVKGYMFRTKTGEISIHAKQIEMLSKSLKPLPIVKEKEGETFDAVSDPEFRYRQRYVDLVINPQVRDTFKKRSTMIQSIRNILNENGALEVDTPVLQSIPGGASARPFITHHNALDMPLYLRIANELYLKRLIVGGYEWVYEFSRNFRNEGMDRTHNPEFTILEFYVAYKDYFWMMDFTEKMLERVAIEMHGSTEVKIGEQTISFKAPFKRISIHDIIKENTGIDISQMNEDELRNVCKQLHIETDKSMGKGKLTDELFSATSEKKCIQPTFIIDYPVEMSPLTKKHRSKAGLVERFELIVNGKEIANAYSELNDPIDQRSRFEEQVELMKRGDDEAMYIDHDFLRALEYGMPPTAGIGFGIDRLCMLMTGQVSIQDVLLFPQMRPETGRNNASETV